LSSGAVKIKPTTSTVSKEHRSAEFALQLSNSDTRFYHTLENKFTEHWFFTPQSDLMFCFGEVRLFACFLRVGSDCDKICWRLVRGVAVWCVFSGSRNLRFLVRNQCDHMTLIALQTFRHAGVMFADVCVQHHVAVFANLVSLSVKLFCRVHSGWCDGVCVFFGSGKGVVSYRKKILRDKACLSVKLATGEERKSNILFSAVWQCPCKRQPITVEASADMQLP